MNQLYRIIEDFKAKIVQPANERLEILLSVLLVVSLGIFVISMYAAVWNHSTPWSIILVGIYLGVKLYKDRKLSPSYKAVDIAMTVLFIIAISTHQWILIIAVLVIHTWHSIRATTRTRSHLA